MTNEQTRDTTLLERISPPLADQNLASVSDILVSTSVDEIVPTLGRLNPRQRAVAFRLLPKDLSLQVFEELTPALQSDVIRSLRDVEVTEIFAELDPDDRVWLLDELPASVAPQLLRGLSDRERLLTAAVLGYPQGSIGRRMSPEYVSARATLTAAQALDRVHARLDDAETVYTVPVLDSGRRVLGVVSLRDLLRADPFTPVPALMRDAQTAVASDDAEAAARRCADQGLLALPIVDNESRLVGILTIDDAVRILEQEESEDAARQGGAEPLRRPYLATPIFSIVRSRVVWLLVLAIGATLTVQVLSVFEATLEQVTVLALFVPLLIGTGGNTGNQAATTVTRALALQDVRPRDIVLVLTRELRVGLSLGTLLGVAGFAVTAVAYDLRIGLVIAATLIVVCTMAAAIGGIMPLIAKAIRVDPAVFSNPFISTFVDATGLVVYFLIARMVLQL